MERRKFLKYSLAATGGLLIGENLVNAQPPTLSLIDRMLPAPKSGGLQMDDYWIWDPSVIKGSDGMYHMFASRWSKEYGFGNWVTNSEIIRAISPTPAGPYTFVEVVLPARGKGFFDGNVTHNARIIQTNGYYALYYFGTKYDNPTPPTSENVWESGLAQKAWMNKRIGMAWSKSLSGPWERVDKPLLEPRPGKWDASITSNPSPVVLPNGKIYLMYKSSPKNYNPPLLLGASMAPSFKGPYARISEDPLFHFHSGANPDSDVEDPFVWWQNGQFELIMKDRTGSICGEEGGGIHAFSKDGIKWTLSKYLKAYSKKILWDDGQTTLQANFERPFLLFENGKPTHLFAATGSGEHPYQLDRSWNMVIPLK